MVRQGDHETSTAAAEKVVKFRNRLQESVLEAFRELGDMTDWTLENLDRFRTYGPSTIRKRRSELYQLGLLKAVGKQRRDNGIPMTIWSIAE